MVARSSSGLRATAHNKKPPSSTWDERECWHPSWFHPTSAHASHAARALILRPVTGPSAAPYWPRESPPRGVGEPGSRGVFAWRSPRAALSLWLPRAVGAHTLLVPLVAVAYVRHHDTTQCPHAQARPARIGAPVTAPGDRPLREPSADLVESRCGHFPRERQ